MEQEKMANLPESLGKIYKELISHIQDLEADPSMILNDRLFDECKTFLTVPLSHDYETSVNLIRLLSELIPKLQQDPQPLVRLLSGLVRHFTFEDILSLQPPVDFVGGLNLHAGPYHELMLEILFKASGRGQDAAIVAGMPSVMLAVIDLWLCTPDIRISNMAARLIVALLVVDRGEIPAAVDNITTSENLVGHGQGLVWKRIFGDKDVYELLFARTTLKPPPNRDIASSQLSKKERTIAQTRLLSILPEIGKLDWSYITTGHHSDVENLYGLRVPNSGVMEYACSHMVDWNEDILVYMNLLDTFTKLIGRVRQVSPTNHHRSVALEYLVERGLHQRTLSILLEPDSSQDSGFEPFEKRLLLAPAALYLAQYASSYKEDFISSVALRPTLERINRELSVGPSRWATGAYSVPDLQVLASLPRIVLLPVTTSTSSPKSSPLLEIPANRANASGLNALSLIFSGLSNTRQVEKLNPEPVEQLDASFSEMEIDSGATSKVTAYWTNQDALAEASATFAVYYSYTNTRPNFIRELTVTADLVAMAGQALAAINLFKSIITTHWAPLPYQGREKPDQLPQDVYDLPSPRQVSIPERLQAFIFPEHIDEESRYSLAGIRSFFASPVQMYFFEWLIKPPQSFSNLVGGGGDPEGSAYQIAVAKFDLLVLVHQRLELLRDTTDERDLLPTGKPFKKQVKSLLDEIDARQREGVWGARAVGSAIATLEM